ncbi:hypothetical protein U1Q18_001921 [Sarracenia purpurea var. burkii]
MDLVRPYVEVEHFACRSTFWFVVLIPSFPVSIFPSILRCLWKWRSTIDARTPSTRSHTSKYMFGNGDTTFTW